MSIIATELVKYGAANRPEDDTSTVGGAIDTSCLIAIITPLAADDVVRAVSSAAGDNTQTLTLTGRTPAGEITSDAIALNGTTVVAGTVTFERILKAVLSGVCVGDVTIERNTNPYDDIAIIPAGKISASIQFIGASSEASATDRYEKAFWKNENASLSLTSATLTLTADPSASVMIGIDTAKDSSASEAGRKTAPTGVTFVDDSVSIDIPGNQLEAGVAIGEWCKFSRGANAAAIKTSYTTELAGQTT